MGTLIEQSIKTLYQGVSRQPDTVRLPGQVQDSQNVLMSVVTGGFESRPGTRHVAQLTDSTAGVQAALQSTYSPFFYSYARDATEKYLITIVHDAATTSTSLLVYDFAGNQKTVTFPDGTSYLQQATPSDNFSAVTIADTTIIANNSKTVAMTASTYAESPFKALVNCKTTNSSTDYTITIDGSSVWSYSGSAKSATEIATDIIANISLPGGFSISRDDLTLTITNSSTFTIGHTGTDDTYGPITMRQNVAKRTHLPQTAPDGYYIRVGATLDGNALGYWAKFSAADGGWIESPDPAADNDFDTSTMPHWLVRQADGTFIFKKGTYDGRLAGDIDTTPNPDFVGSQVEGVVFHRNRLGLIAGETVYFSQSNKYFTFWPDFSTQSLDSDGFGLTASGSEVNLLKHAHPFRKALFMTSDKNQFEVSGDDVLTPEKATVDMTTAYLTETACAPVSMGSRLFFAAKSGKDAVVYEYEYDDESLSNRASDITLHALGYLPAPIVRMTADPVNDTLFVLSNSSATERTQLYMYRMYIDGDKKAQSAWHKWNFSVTGIASNYIHYMTVIEGDLYIIIQRGTLVFIEKIPLRYQLADSKHPYQVCLDRQQNLTGSYSSGTGLTTWTSTLPHVSLAKVVLSTDFATGTEGEAPTLTYDGDGTTITTSGDYSGGEAIIGVPFTQEVQLSKLYMRDPENTARTMTTGRFQLKRFQVNYQSSGYFNVSIVPAFRSEQLFTFNGRIIGSGDNLVGHPAIATGQFSIPIQTEANTCTIKIQNSTELPMVITGVDYTGYYNEETAQE